MGKDFIYVAQNGFDLVSTYNRLKNKEVVEASEISYFNRNMPKASNIAEIELGTSGTKESIIRLKDNGFIVVKGTIPVNKLKKSN